MAKAMGWVVRKATAAATEALKRLVGEAQRKFLFHKSVRDYIDTSATATATRAELRMK